MTFSTGPALFALLGPGAAAAVWVRSRWIRAKIGALRGPSDDRFDHQNASLPPRHRFRIVLIGDSRVAQWPAACFGADCEIVNRGVGGETSAQLARRFSRDAIGLHPHLIVVATGINDLVAASFLRSTESLSVLRSLERVLVDLARQADAAGIPIAVSTVIPPARPTLLRRLVWSETLRRHVLFVNDRLRQVAWPRSAVLLDAAAVLDRAASGCLADSDRRDTLHIDPHAYDELTATLKKCIDEHADRRSTGTQVAPWPSRSTDQQRRQRVE